MSDIRKWFMKQHNENNGNSTKLSKPVPVTEGSSSSKNPPVNVANSGRRKTSKYFSQDKQEPKGEKDAIPAPEKRKIENVSVELPSNVKLPPKKLLKVVEDLVTHKIRRKDPDTSPAKKSKNGSNQSIGHQDTSHAKHDRDDVDHDYTESPVRSGGRGRGRGAVGAAFVTASSGGRGRGGGRAGFINFGERKDPPHKGEKEVPEGHPDCLEGLTFVISGTLDSLEREEAEDLIKRHGGRVTTSVSKKTNFLLCDEDIGGRKSSKAKELGTSFLTEDGLFDMIRASNPTKDSKIRDEKSDNDVDLAKKSPQKVKLKVNEMPGTMKSCAASRIPAFAVDCITKSKTQATKCDFLPWTDKYKPKTPNDIVGNQSLIKQLHDWLAHWKESFLQPHMSVKGKKQNDAGTKKAVLLSGTPGIGKTSSAKLVCQMLGFQAIEVNASDSRGKADTKIEKGLLGRSTNSIKELITNEAMAGTLDCTKHLMTVLIMDEVDGMSAGDRGGVADLISSIKISKIPIICICNDRYSQKLKSLVNYCQLLSFRKPTKQQMAKRLLQIANAEGIEVNEIALEEIAERVNGDMRMALNQLQYMSLSLSVIKYEDVRQRLLNSTKDEDISPFAAVDKLFGFNGGKLRMDERIDLSMSDLDLVPLLVQENYLNYRPTAAGRDDDGVKRMNFISQAAESIGDGDIINVQIRRYRQWQLSQNSSLASCIIPAALLHGQRETLEQGERNFNRFGGWLGKNSTMGKNRRLLDDLHVHLMASRESNCQREELRVDYLTILLKRLTGPLRVLPKEDAVRKVVDFLDMYSLSQEDFDTIIELSKFQGHVSPLDGIQPAVKASLTKACNQGTRSRMVRSADLVTLPGVKKGSKKRIATMLEPEAEVVENDEMLAESEDEDHSDAEGTESQDIKKKLQSDLQDLNTKGIKVELNTENGSAIKKTATGKGRGRPDTAERKGAKSVAKRKR